MCSACPQMLELSEQTEPHSGLVGPLRLRRARPQRPDALAVEYVDAAGAVIPGVWYPDAQASRRRVAQSSECGGLVMRIESASLVLQPNGVDPRLPALAALLETAGSRLLSHRPGRRAVVSWDSPEGVRFAKALRPSRSAHVIEAHRRVLSLPKRAFDVAAIHTASCDQGVLVTTAIDGICLHDMPTDDPGALLNAYRAVGEGLRSLHVPAPTGVAVHDAEAESSMLATRVECVRVFAPNLYASVDTHAKRVCDHLRAHSAQPTLVHRDLYDKQVVVCGEGRIGLLDFDTLAAGEPEIDLANMLAHLELRVLQGTLSRELAELAATEFLEGYGQSSAAAESSRITAYLDASRLRLAILYAFWPKWSSLSDALAQSIGQPSAAIRSDRRGRCAERVVCSAERYTRGRDDRSPCPLVFVVGCPRSGTTMLERMLDAHPLLAMAHESHWVTKHGTRGRDLTDQGLVRPRLLQKLYADHRFVRMAPDRDELQAYVADVSPDYPSFVRHVYASYGAVRGSVHVGDKSTGGYVRKLARLHTICPQSRLVHLIRDGRDVCLSMLTWPKAGRAAARHGLWAVDPVATTALWWRWHVSAGIEQGRALSPTLYREVRYEQLVSEPAATCAELCAFLGLAPDAQMATFHQRPKAPATGRSANAAWLAPTPGLRNWQTQMPEASVEMFEAIAGDLLEELEYERRHPRISPAVSALAQEYAARWEAEPRVHVVTRGAERQSVLAGSPRAQGEKS